jgi:hypothetical protein
VWKAVRLELAPAEWPAMWSPFRLRRAFQASFMAKYDLNVHELHADYWRGHLLP